MRQINDAFYALYKYTCVSTSSFASSSGANRKQNQPFYSLNGWMSGQHQTCVEKCTSLSPSLNKIFFFLVHSFVRSFHLTYFVVVANIQWAKNVDAHK